jgi:alpha-glucosidase (family GH31 glycosyl hydrolase)
LSCACAEHADGAREYDAHNLFGTTMAMRNSKAATAVMGKRPFLLLRCAWRCTGVHARGCCNMR